jgi:hypothetical protein
VDINIRFGDDNQSMSSRIKRGDEIACFQSYTTSTMDGKEVRDTTTNKPLRNHREGVIFSL